MFSLGQHAKDVVNENRAIGAVHYEWLLVFRWCSVEEDQDGALVSYVVTLPVEGAPTTRTGRSKCC